MKIVLHYLQLALYYTKRFKPKTEQTEIDKTHTIAVIDSLMAYLADYQK